MPPFYTLTLTYYNIYCRYSVGEAVTDLSFGRPKRNYQLQILKTPYKKKKLFINTGVHKMKMI